MNWQTTCQRYPNKWLLIEPLKSHIDERNHQIIDNFEMVEVFESRHEGLQKLQEVWQSEPASTLLLVSTEREELRFLPNKPMKAKSQE
ncbi:MAG: hypothetical protein GY796_07545 [Chloroflexi bacterium]|nr:hypothetical protein [Chloroflexota bacterium]